MSLILFSMRSTKLNGPLMRIHVEGSLDFFAVSFWHVKTKNLSLSHTKVWGMVRDFSRAVYIFWEPYKEWRARSLGCLTSRTYLLPSYKQIIIRKKLLITAIKSLITLTPGWLEDRVLCRLDARWRWDSAINDTTDWYKWMGYLG